MGTRLTRTLAALLLLTAPAYAQTLESQVTRIRDGDTIEVETGGEIVPIRLNGLAAPEREEPGGPEATAAMRIIVDEAGGRLRCELTGETSYDRQIGVCFTPDGQDIAALMVALGVARDCPRYSGGRYAEFETEASRALPLPGYCRP